jgi:hypothetical protein
MTDHQLTTQHDHDAGDPFAAIAAAADDALSFELLVELYDELEAYEASRPDRSVRTS